MTLALALVAGMFAWQAAETVAAPGGTPAPVAKQVDPATYHEYPGSVDASGYFAASSNPGRIWADKSVFDDSATSPLEAGIGPQELGVGLSALGSTRQVSRAEAIPVDTALVVDFSGSMAWCVGNSTSCTANNGAGSRAAAMVAATNSAIDVILSANPANRVSVVQFATSTGTLLDLGRPEPITPGGHTYLRLCAAGNQLFVTQEATGCTIVRAQITGSTNVQRGIYRGMEMLASQPAAEVAGKRMPSVIVMSDGEPTTSAGPLDQPAWWSIGSGGTAGSSFGKGSPGDPQYPGTGFMAVLTASYLKNRIDQVYATSEQEGTRARVYTVGLGIDGLSTQGKALAQVTLDPRGNYDSASNAFAASFRTAFTSYRSSGGTGTIDRVLVNLNQNYTNIKHPSGAGAVPSADPTSLKYNDGFYSTATAADLNKVFEEIATTITEAAPNYPTEVEAGSPSTSGYLTLTDQLGDFMGVSEMSQVTFCMVPNQPSGSPDPTHCEQTTFLNPTVTKASDTVTRYTFHGTVDANQAAGPTDLAKLIVDVTANPSLQVGDIVTVKLPAALLPMRDTHVTEDSDGNPTEVDIDASHPVHLYYKVAPKPGVIEALGNPAALNSETSSDGTALAQYIASHTFSGKVRFYSNTFSANSDTGETVATFRPADLNDFYRFANDSPLFATSNVTTTPITLAQWNEMKPSDVVYYTVVSYRNDTVPPTKSDMVLQTTKKALLDGEDPTHAIAPVNGAMTAPQGLLDLSGRANNLDQVKCLKLVWQDNLPVCQDPAGASVAGNLTGTASQNRVTTMTEQDAQNVTMRLGNNGYLDYSVPGTLQLSKTVNAAPGLNPKADQQFDFTVGLTDSGGSALPGTYPYSIYDSSDPTTPVADGTIANGGTLKLKANQVATVLSLPDGARYTITEGQLPAGYSQTSPGGGAPAQGTISEDATATADFVNTYEAAPTPAVATPQVTKAIEGRSWGSSDSFAMTLCGAGQPLPAGAADGCASTSVSSPTAPGTFGTITFPAPGSYTYAITETPGSSPGMTYSMAIYRWTVTVTDDGTGTLAAKSELTRIVTDAGADASQVATTAAFTNTFDAEGTSLALLASKSVRDMSRPGDEEDQIRPPVQPYTFAFAPVAAIPSLADAIPLPSGCTITSQSPACLVETTAGIHDVQTGPISFTADQVGHEVYYSVREVPDARTFLTFDTAVYFYRVAVTTATGADGAVVQATTTACKTDAAAVAASAPWGACSPDSGNYGEGNVPAFRNIYDPDPGELALPVTKALDGRAWQTGDSFTFRVAPYDEATKQAVSDGEVTMPSSDTISISDKANPSGQFAGFTFQRQGSYQFGITEVAPDPPAPGMTYASRTLVYDVVVSDSKVSGALDAVAAPQGGEAAATFTNRYRATQVYAGAAVTKTLSGRDQAAGEFSFDVRPDDDASATLAGIDTAGTTLKTTVDAGDEQVVQVPFLNDLTLTQADLGSTFGYQVSENAGQAKGVTYDQASYAVRLQPHYDAETGALYVITTVTKDSGDPVSYDSRTGETPAVPFANSYKAGPGTATLELSKVIAGRGWLPGESFTFVLSAVSEDAPMPAETKVTVSGAEGSDDAADVKFGPISFAETGTFEYSVQEVAPVGGAPGMTFDSSSALATVIVSDDGSGTLQTEVGFDGNQDFVNYYDSEYDIRLDVTKTLTGRDLAAREFTFRAVPQDAASAAFAHAPLEGVTFTNLTGAADGQPVLMQRLVEILATQDDAGHTYCYDYSEVPGTLPGVSYDKTSYTACLEIADDGLGVITMTATVTGSDGSKATTVNRSDDDPAQPWPQVSFENSYESTPTPTPTPSKSVPPAPTVTPTPTKSVPPAPTVTPSPTKSVPPTPTVTPTPAQSVVPSPPGSAGPTPGAGGGTQPGLLAQTGAWISGGLALAGAVMVAFGIAFYAGSRRRRNQ